MGVLLLRERGFLFGYAHFAQNSDDIFMTNC